MTEKEAYKILGIAPGAKANEIKKRYRQIMQRIHPDVCTVPENDYTYDVRSVNLAYSVLVKDRTAGHGKEPCGGAGHGEGPCGASGHGEERKKGTAWDAPVNAAAYAEREILHNVVDSDGTVLGRFCVAKGKYLWRPEEDFPLFLLSIYKMGERLLDEVDSGLHRTDPPSLRQEIRAELVYLLAQQFMGATALLEELAGQGTDREGHRIFYLRSMLELSGRAARLKEGETLYPSGVRGHRLYLKDRAGQELGYLSFWDDRFYYIVIPLFEQKRVQVKIKAAGGRKGKGRRASLAYQNLHLWIRMREGDVGGAPEDLNLQIGRLLEAYGGKA